MQSLEQTIDVGGVEFGASRLALIAGPCVIESHELCRDVAAFMKDVCARLDIGYVFKASFDKANRTSVSAFRGQGMAEGLDVLDRIKREYDVPVLTDIHESKQAGPTAEVADILQIPAFLCRQTDLLRSAAETGRTVNVKKGQFLAPWDVENIVRKMDTFGCSRVLLTERGTTFGYNSLIVDMTSLPIMRSFGRPVVFDATHSLQQPGAAGTQTGGRREFIPHLARAAVAVGVDALFMEVHPDPARALSDAATMLPLSEVEPLLRTLLRIREAVG